MTVSETMHDCHRATRASGSNEAQRAGANFTFVQREEYCNLLLSTRRMVRSDEPGHHIRGLLDLETGMRFLIEQEKLFAT